MSAAVLWAGAAFAGTTVRVGHVLNPDHPWNVALEGLASELAAATEGRVTLKIFHSAQLGNEKDLIEGLKMGTVDGALVGGSSFQSLDPKFGIEELPYAFATNEQAYKNIYLGEATGTGLNVFENVRLQPITDDQIKTFDYIYRGVDWGYYPDPFQYVAIAYQKATLYIFDELRRYKHGNIEAFDALKDHMNNQYDRYRYDTRQKGEKDRIAIERITADSAEPKSIADFRSFGADMRGALKGAGSRDAGFKWLQGLDAIIIDPVRCPHAADEFTLYEYEIDKRSGDVMTGYPNGQPDHCMDAVRYAMEKVYRRAGA